MTQATDANDDIGSNDRGFSVDRAPALRRFRTLFHRFARSGVEFAETSVERAKRTVFRRRMELMDDLEMSQYLLDLQGYLVIEDALSTSELTALNAILDEQRLPLPEQGEHARFGHAPDGSGFLQWGQPLCDLLDHSRIMPILRMRLGDHFRLDRLFGTVGRTAWGELHADYGAMSPNAESVPREHFHFHRHEITDGFMVVAWNLSDTGPEQGGFCCIPGSHKSNFRVPKAIFDAPESSPHVVVPAAPAGSVVLFTEALLHGATAWKGDHQRRTLIYKYCVSHTAWRPGSVQPPDNVQLTQRQRRLLRPPADARLSPSLFE